MIALSWVRSSIQPISVRDVTGYLTLALDRGGTGVIDIGADLSRKILPVPVLAPSLAARWVELVTPIPNRLAVPLVEGILHDLVADTRRAREIFPEIEPLSYRRAVELALERIEARDVRTRWSGALGAMPVVELEDSEGLMREERTLEVDAPPDAVYRAFAGLGGDRGWPAFGWAWRLRGFLDRVVGGPGLRRGRRRSWELDVGEALDFWRVELTEPPQRLRLRAEMRLPGRGWLQWETEPRGAKTLLRQTAVFAPHGLWGTVYWRCLYPFHRPIFARLIRAVAAEAEANVAEQTERSRLHPEEIPVRNPHGHTSMHLPHPSQASGDSTK